MNVSQLNGNMTPTPNFLGIFLLDINVSRVELILSDVDVFLVLSCFFRVYP